MNVAQKSKKIHQKTNTWYQKRTGERVEILGLAINSTQKEQVLRLLTLQRKELLHLATVNPEYVMQARMYPDFAKVLSQSITTADGWGIVWAARLLKDRSIERVSGTSLVEEILRLADKREEKVFLLGAGEGVAAQAASLMNIRYPHAKISFYEGAENIRLERREEASMTIARINAVSPDYLLVAYGSPRQDMWIEENRPYLRARVAMGVGGVLDEWAGLVAVCPAWIDQIGLKWAWRLAHEPKRFFRVLRVFQFATLVLYHKLID